MRPKVIARSTDCDGGALVECPVCKTQALADRSQIAGAVSMICDCGYHETHDLRSAVQALEAATDGR